MIISLRSRMGLILASAAALMSAGLAAYLIISARAWAPEARIYPNQGVAVSAAQGQIHWPSVAAAGARFAYIRATKGASARDQRFAQNWAQSAAAGLQRGAVHFYSLCESGLAQATNFIASVPRAVDALPPALDLSFSQECTARPATAAVINDLAIVIELIERHSGKPAILAIAPEFEEYYGVSARIARTLWLRRQFLMPRYGARPWVLWQVSTLRRVQGITGPVNWNVVRE